MIKVCNNLFSTLVVVIAVAVVVETAINLPLSENNHGSVKVSIEFGSLDSGVINKDINACNATCKRDCDISCGLQPTCRYLCYIAQCGCPGKADETYSDMSSNKIDMNRAAQIQKFSCSEVCFVKCMETFDGTDIGNKQICKSKCCFNTSKWY